jgi:hypothetical protein
MVVAKVASWRTAWRSLVWIREHYHTPGTEILGNSQNWADGCLLHGFDQAAERREVLEEAPFELPTRSAIEGRKVRTGFRNVSGVG